MHYCLGRTIRNASYGVGAGNFQAAWFFCLTFPFYEFFFFRPGLEYFLGLLGVHESSVDPIEKSAFKLVELPSLKVICWKLMNIQLLKVAKFYRRLYGGGRKLAPPPSPPFPNTTVQTSGELYLRSLKTYHFQVWQFLLILRCSLVF